jgi:hypothetical protein
MKLAPRDLTRRRRRAGRTGDLLLRQKSLRRLDRKTIDNNHLLI